MSEIFAKYLKSQIQINDSQLEMIQKVCVVRRLRKHQYLLQEGQVWGFNAFVTKGCLRTYSINDRLTETIINFAVENYWTGDRESLFNGLPSRFNIDAVEESEVLLISKENFAMLMKAIPQFQDLFNLIMEYSLLESQNRINSTISYSAEEKYTIFIDKYFSISLRVPQHMVASYLGITPQTLSRIRSRCLKSKN